LTALETVLVVCVDEFKSQDIMEKLYDCGINSIGPAPTAGLALALAGQTRPTVAIVAGPPGGRRDASELASRLLADWGVPSWVMDEAESDATSQWAPLPEQMERLTTALGLDQDRRL
jgi:uncharacterized protein YbjT (DUF2867 family)